MSRIRSNDQLEEREKEQILNVKRMKSMEDVLEEVEVLIDTHFFNKFWEMTKSSTCLRQVNLNQM